jgi:hypothetical protein
MADLKKAQDEAVALVDTAKAMMDKILSVMELFIQLPTASINYSVNPMHFLLRLLRSVGVTDKELKDFFTYLLLGALPALEVAIKAILLTNLKNLISCSIDPRIPEQYRKYSIGGSTQDAQRRGIDIDISSIDMFDKLSICPLTDAGREYYFGLEGVENVYTFARADDMDAFLWFVKNKGKFPSSTNITNDADLKTKTSADSVLPVGGNLFMEQQLLFSSTNPSKVIAGNTFRYSGTDTRITSMCVESFYDEELNITKNTLLPVSDDLTSVNWYIRRADQLAKNIGIGWNSKKAKSKTKAGRDFSKERAICNLQFMESMPDADLAGLINNKFRFTILPKPYVHVPNIGNGEPPWRFKKILFNEKGELDSNGKLTLGGIPTETYDKTNKVIKITGTGYELQIDIKSGNISVVTPTKAEDITKYLVECYPGLTVFEFNYDYVMGMKLFDARVIATQLLNSLMDLKIGIGANISIEHQDALDEIKSIVKEIIESDDSQVNDCFFTFDNTKYSALLRAAEIKRANSHNRNSTINADIAEINQILREYDANATLNEQTEVLKRAITKASVTVSEGADESDRVMVEFNFITDLIQNLIQTIVYSVFSPKVLMLLEVNETLMGGKWQKFTFKDLMMAMRSIIISIINEVRDLVLQELLKLLKDKLQPLIEMMTSVIAREQIEDYVDAINELIRNCPVIWFKFGNELLDTKLDTVDYADIDTSHIKPG